MNTRDLAFHGLAIKRYADAATVAALVGAPESDIATTLDQAVAAGRAVKVKEGFSLTPLARVALEARYGLLYGAVRLDATFIGAYERFEIVNRDLKQVITDWQTVTVSGVAAPNDHADRAYDARVLDRLGKIHDRIEPVLAALARVVPRLKIYAAKLAAALDKAEDGDTDWVSDIRRESYHTVWFELHEDLLRIMGTVRDE
jgi:hypothetical protein